MPISNTTLLKSTYLRVFYIIVIPEGQKVPLWSVPSKNEGCRNGVRVRVPHRHVDHCENPKLRQNRLQCKVRPINETWCVATCSIFSDSIDMFCTSTWLERRENLIEYMYAIASMCHHVVLLHVSISLLTLPSIWRLPFSMLAKKVISPNIATCAVLPTVQLFIQINLRTLTHEVNESSDHENWMQIPLQVWILFPWKRPWWVRFGMVLNDPKEDQSQNTMEKDLGYKDQKSETASSPARHFVIVAFAVPVMKTVWNRLEIGLNSKMV